MVSAELVEAVFAAHEGNYDMSKKLQELVKPCKDAPNPALNLEMQHQLMFTYDLLSSLTRLSYVRTEEELLRFLSKSGAVPSQENYLECADILRFYGFTLLVKFVEHNWHRLSEENKSRCKNDVEDIFSFGRQQSTLAASYNSLTLSKVSQYVATIALREWPVGWAEFIPLCLKSLNEHFLSRGAEASECKQTMAELFIFGSMLSEVSVDITDCMDNKVLHKKRNQIILLFQKHICDIFIMLHRVIVLGLHKANPCLLQLVVTIFRNLSGIMDGNIFIEFDVDEFLRANIGSAKRSDVIQTLHNISRSVDHKELGNVYKHPEFSFSTKDIYKVKLDRFLRNIVLVGEAMPLDCTLETTSEELQLTQTIKVLFEKNGTTVLTNVTGDSLKILWEYILTRLVMHPSLQIATSAVGALNLIIRRATGLGEKYTNGENHGGIFVPNIFMQWLDSSKFLLVIFIRCLKIGNLAIHKGPMGGEPTASATVDAFIAEACGTPILKSQRWSELLFKYAPIDDEFAVGQLKNFDNRFASLRSSILSCVSLHASINQDYMDLSINAIGEIFNRVQWIVMDEPCINESSICMVPRLSEKHLQWTCKKLIFFDGACFMFESALFRARSMALEPPVNMECSKLSEWMSPQSAKSLVLKGRPDTGANIIHRWITSGMSYLGHMLSLPLPNVHGAQLEVRRLSLLSSSAMLLLYNREHMERILEYVVGLLLIHCNGNWEVTKVHKAALSTLVTICKCCSALVSPYVQPIIQRMQQCLASTENESSRDLILESIVALTSCTQNFETQRLLSYDIIAPYTDEINQVAQTIAHVKPEERPYKLFDLLYESGGANVIGIRDSQGGNLMDIGPSDSTLLENNRKRLRRAINMCLSIIKCSVVPRDQEHRMNGGFIVDGRVRHPLEDLLPKLLSSSCTIVSALAGMWRPAFRDQNEWRQAVLSPGEEEWISLHGFNEAIATEDSLRRIVESVFKIPVNMEPKVVHRCRRHDFLLRQAAFKLCGEIFTIAYTHRIELFIPTQEAMITEALVEPLKWVAMSNLGQFLKLALIPAKSALRQLLSGIITTIMERINAEWKALNRVQRNLLEEEPRVSSSGAESRILHLYYLRVYACIETGMQLLTLIGSIFKTRLMVTMEPEADAYADDVTMDGTPVSEQISVVFGAKELMTSILQCLCSAICWPHYRCVTESLRLMRTYAKLAVQLDSASLKLAETFAMELLLFLHNQLRIERTFDPLNLGNDESQGSTTTPYKRFWSNTKDGSINYIKEFVNTMSSFYECLIRCQSGIISVLNQGEINVQALMGFSSVVEAIKLLTPYLQEHECLGFLKNMLTQNTVTAKTMLQTGIEENILDQKESTNAKLAQFRASILETRSAKEIEKRGSGNSDDDLLGSDIAYLLFE